LTGKLMLFVGELDTNVDPASTMQVVNASHQSEQRFRLVVFPAPVTAKSAPTANAGCAISSFATSWRRTEKRMNHEAHEVHEESAK